MGNKIVEILNESIKLELNVAELYMLFYEIFPEDSSFWWDLCMEEKNHASLLRSGLEFVKTSEIFPEEVLAPTIEKLHEINTMITGLIKEYRENKPSKDKAFSISITLEKSAGEFHFQESMNSISDSKLLKVFQMLNKDDRDHAERIEQYARSLGFDL